MGGEHEIHLPAQADRHGSSPRGRGTRAIILLQPCPSRFIPAWAGNTPGVFSLSMEKTGSSPRGRGTRRAMPPPMAHARFIPAWAGNTATAMRSYWTSSVHPRVGGEHKIQNWLVSSNSGSSPRGRGTRSRHLSSLQGGRFIPAWAGNTCRIGRCRCDRAVHPRVGGEHHHRRLPERQCFGSSPRGRGTLAPFVRFTVMRRFIPAWAGNTASFRSDPLLASVHPRVGGEHVHRPDRLIQRIGSSPRGRGTRICPGQSHLPLRFIPAWAGNTRQKRQPSDVCAVHPRVGGEHCHEPDALYV